MDNEALARAAAALEKARLSRCMGDVGHEVAGVRKALAEAGATPEDIGSSDAELYGFVREGLLAEARNIFDIAAHGCDYFEKSLLFDHVAELITRSVKVGCAMDEAAAEDLRRKDPCAGLDVATRAETSKILADVDIDRLELNFEPSREIPDDDDYPEITVLGTESLTPEAAEALGDESDDPDEQTMEVGDDEILEEAPASSVSIIRRLKPPPLPVGQEVVSFAGPSSHGLMYLPGESPDGPPSFTGQEASWFTKGR